MTFTHINFLPGDQATSNSNLDQQLRARDVMLGVLKEHLRDVQERMKKFADRKRREVEFEVGDLVYLKLRPYRQSSMMA